MVEVAEAGADPVALARTPDGEATDAQREPVGDDVTFETAPTRRAATIAARSRDMLHGATRCLPTFGRCDTGG